MASNLPIPLPPRTPTPPPDDPPSAQDNSSRLDAQDKDSLSPLVDTFPLQRGSLNSEDPNRLSPTRASFALSPSDNVLQNSQGDNGSAGPFNFKTTTMAKSPVVKSNIGQRRGHKYKHSSISHQIFLEPPPRAPLALPNSLPIPTFKECRASMSKDQKTRFWWSVCHMFVAAYTLWSAHGSLAMTALSHLILFDSLGALLCVSVDVLSNFEVWKRSSVRHPFGLERAEVLAGFAMCVLLLFMGMDLISHNLQHFLESSGHEPHHSHAHERVSVGSVDVTALLAITSTLISAIGLKNHGRIGKAMRFGYIESLPSVLSNPSHFLTLSCSTLLLLLPLVSVRLYNWLDVLLSSTISISMCVLGVRLVKTLGSMLLMSYSGPGVKDVIRDIEADPCVFGVDDARIWQVHYGLCMADLKLRVSGSEENLIRLRERISSLVRNRLGGGYGSGGQRWEVSLQFTIEKS
ncbi:cation efflux family protein family [Aspergillus pseudonomiae]|uniref:Zinc transporter n=1 Tax=Aspergillus pseudonomiae TaxID=1506151 RepID=A0A5N7CUY7_9EURO|nr:cation efflux family protein family [Aspergillus pseudonomiae]KAB8263477.1 cation efflux family protein family [Aspergillus pseudonomiae]KAE8397954.1 cation efflux family protein family [Aspergillus pseudonomiae]